jgi:flagellin
LQAEISQLQDEIDNISERTNFNGIGLFEGTKTRLDFQYGANAGDNIHINLTKMDTDALGRQARYTSTGGVSTIESLTNGGANILKINGIEIRDSLASDDTVSKYSQHDLIHTGARAQGASAIAKAAAINSVSDVTKVKAIVGETRTDNQSHANRAATGGFPPQAFGNTGSIQGTTLDANNYMEINGVKIAGFSFEDQDSSGELTRQINAHYDVTGVIAEVNSAGELVLVAKDGRDISISYVDAADPFGSNLEAEIGLLSGLGGAFAYGGEITLQSNETFTLEATDPNSLNNTLGGLLKANDDPDIIAEPYVLGTNREATVGSIDLTTNKGAIQALEVIDLALEQISSERSQLGALQNRTESTINNLSQTAENLSAASSRIKDADFAQETAQLASHQIKQQAAVSMLAQMSQSGQVVLSLLQ